ncbi:MAG: GNAT family N-acetyltransferase [Spirochaetaceae bacterium]|nr:MAG: GNAT family N-acetyltransferase [Spirochaetaceae bacterium]
MTPMNTPGFEIRRAVPEDLALLPGIERLAGYLFKTYPLDLGIPEEMYQTPNSVETFAAAQKAGRLWVATVSGEELVGFALAMEIEGYAHLEEIDVLPSYGGKGIGSALLARVCSWATDTGHPAVTLRTFRDVPWNGPFYQSRGFRIVDSAALSAAHVELEVSERQRGLRTDTRVTMVYETAG